MQPAPSAGVGRSARSRGSRAANRLAEVQALFDVEAARGGRVLLVTYKAAAERLKAPPDCAVECFGNIRGIDLYKDFDTVIIAGREQPPVDAAEAQARALFADDPEPLILTGDLMEMTRGYRLRDGRSIAGKVAVHADPRVQAVIEQVRERETAQAIDRLRLIHRTVPARVIVLSNAVLDLTVDHLVTWKEIMPSRFEQAAARGPAVPLSASELARCFADLWLSVEAAKHELRRAEAITYGSENLGGKSDLNRAKPHIEEFLYGKWPYLNRRTNLKVFYRRLGQKGRASPAAVRADAADPRAALESVVGPVVWFEIEQETELAAAAQAEPPAEPAEAEPVNGDISQIDAEPVEDIDQQLRIVASAGRLADLSARLDYARPPPRWGDFTDARRERDWRAHMTALHEMRADGWLRRRAVNV